MLNAILPHLRSRSYLQAAAMLSLAVLVGCSGFNKLRGDGFSDSFEESAGYKRPVEKSSRSFGYSTKAQEIERDFGVR